MQKPLNHRGRPGGGRERAAIASRLVRDAENQRDCSLLQDRGIVPARERSGAGSQAGWSPGFSRSPRRSRLSVIRVMTSACPASNSKIGHVLRRSTGRHAERDEYTEKLTAAEREGTAEVGASGEPRSGATARPLSMTWDGPRFPP